MRSMVTMMSICIYFLQTFQYLYLSIHPWEQLVLGISYSYLHQEDKVSIAAVPDPVCRIIRTAYGVRIAATSGILIRLTIILTKRTHERRTTIPSGVFLLASFQQVSNITNYLP